MAAVPIASLRAINGACLRQVTAQRSILSLASRRSIIVSRPSSVIAAHVNFQCQKRQQSTAPKPKEDSAGNKNKNAPPRPPPSGWRFFLRLLSFRNVFSSLTPKGLKTLFRQSPVELVVALLILGSLTGIAGYIVKVCVDYFYARQFTKYPPSIAKSLRRALYYTNIRSEPELARKWYKKALEQCDELGLDPYSDDVLGIRIQTAAWLEKIGNYKGATTVLESVLKDCNNWVATMEQGLVEGSVDKSGKPPTKHAVEKVGNGPEEEAPENLWHKRNRLLAKAVGTSTKLGELYADDHVNDSASSQKRLTWAVETALRESRRRSTEGVKPEEGPWLKPEEFGGAMESLARHYESKSQFHLAVPLLFQALRLCQSPCHRLTIMNNLAAAFAQHPVLGSTESEDKTSPMTDLFQSPGMPSTREGFLDAAWNWARNARQHAKDVDPGERTPECDEACAVALSNMADIAAMRGNTAQARRLSQKCIEFSTKIGHEQALAQAQGTLRRLGN